MEADRLARQLKEAREAYYNSDTPIMSDVEFDAMEEDLRKLAPQHSYFTTVGTESNGTKIEHSIPMLSMGKGKKPEDIFKWMDKLKLPETTTFTIEPKIDGLSATCKYQNGKLIYVSTRGDGSFGQDVSHIAEYMQDIPQEISFSQENLEIRGELYLPKDTSYDTKGKPLRNNCVGLINRKDDRDDLHHVRFAAYQIVAEDILTIPKRESEKIEVLKAEGFHSVESKNLIDRQDLDSYYQLYLDSLRDSWLYETDGLIIIVDDCNLHEEIDSRWVVDHHHHYSIALKPPAAFQESTLIGVEWQVSRLGSLIPVAIFEPIKLGGATLERATLHNAQFARDLLLIAGDKLVIERANDVIPYVRKNLGGQDRSAEGFIHPMIPRSCPVCQSTLLEDGVHLKCSNPKCPERSIQSILYWVRMSEMDQVAEATIRQLYQNGKISSISDLYRIKTEDLEELDGFAEKKIDNFLRQVEKTRRLSSLDFIAKLGIPLVQKKALIRLGINSIEDFLNFQDTNYVIGQNLIQWREESNNRALMDELLQVLEIETATLSSSNNEVCMTGKGPMGRKELSKKLEEMGYLVSSSVSTKTTLLLTDDPQGNSSKLKKARQYGVTIQSYEDFFSSNSN